MLSPHFDRGVGTGTFAGTIHLKLQTKEWGVPTYSGYLARRSFLCRTLKPNLLPDVDSGDGVEQSKYIAEPPQHANDNDCV